MFSCVSDRLREDGSKSLDLLLRVRASLPMESKELRGSLSVACKAYSSSLHKVLSSGNLMDLHEHDLFTRKIASLVASAKGELLSHAGEPLLTDLHTSLSSVAALCTVTPSRPPPLPLQEWSARVGRVSAELARNGRR